MIKKMFLRFSLLLFSGIASSSFISCKNGNKATNQATDPDVVVINGIHWAKCNIDKPGTFAAAPEESGMFYQWNNNVGWSATNPIVNSNGGKKWDHNRNSSTKDGYMITSWATNNDPSPKGWRLPSAEEFRTLLDTEKVSNEWTIQNGVNGRKFTDKKTGQSIFFPAAGNRYDASVEFEEDNENLYDVGASGNYWSSGSSEDGDAYTLSFYISGVSVDGMLGYLVNSGGLSIRSVKKNCIETLATPEKEHNASSLTVEKYFNVASFSWKYVSNAQFYIVNWSLDGREGSFTTYDTSSKIKLPNVEGHLFVDIYACGSFCDEWVQSSSPAQFSIQVVPPPQPGPSPDLYTHEEEINIDDLINLFDNISQGFEILTKYNNHGEIKLIKIANSNDVAIEASDKILKSLGLTKNNNRINYRTLFLHNDFRTSFDLKKMNTALTWINYGIKIFDISIYWNKTQDRTGALAWASCEGIKIGTSMALMKIGAMTGGVTGSVVPGVGTAVGGLVGGFAGMIYGMTIDCKETFTNKK